MGPHWRRNADERLRSLERMAASGDPGAKIALISHAVRSGRIDALPLEEKLALRWAVTDSLPYDVRLLEEAGDMGRMNLSPDGRQYGWFPFHYNNLLCPRGHRWREGSRNFWITDGCTIEYPYVVGPEGAYIDYEQEDLTGSVVALVCDDCRARWPLTGENGVSWLADDGGAVL